MRLRRNGMGAASFVIRGKRELGHVKAVRERKRDRKHSDNQS